MRNKVTACILSLCLGVGAAVAQPAHRFAIETLAETRAGCSVIALDDAGLHVDDAGTRVKLASFVELRRDGVPLPRLLTRDFIILTTGDRIPLDPAAGVTLDENRLLVWPAKNALPAANEKGIYLYVPYVVSAFWSLPDGVDDAELFFADLEKESRKRDVLYLRNGDRIEGTLTGLGARSGSVMTVAGKRVETPWSKIAGLAWTSERAVRPRAKKSMTRVVLEGGARLSVTDLRLDAKTRQWAGKPLFGAKLEWPEENLIAADMQQENLVDLSSLAPLSYEQRPFVGEAWALGRNVAATGRALQLAGSTFENGIGLHAPARVTYKLDGKYERFDALVGIDEQSRRGRARIALELDGKRVELHDGKELTSKDVPVTVRQDVRGVRELTLVVELGAFGDVQANVNWAKARLQRK